MIYVATTADKIWSRHGIALSGAFAFVIATLASGGAAWIADGDVSNDIDASSFDDRFDSGEAPNLLSMDFSRPLVRYLPPELEGQFQQARDRLALALKGQDQPAAVVGEPERSIAAPASPASPASAAAIPIPRPRPVEASPELRDDALVAKTENRTILQKLSDLIPARLRLASLAPDGGLLSDGPKLSSLGYDNFTAVYDISARTVYLPNGTKLEAHSGLGKSMDDPASVGERNVGATPPNVYDLKPRERLFHGVQALRMIPVDAKGTFGRSGLLAHSYMLGANGDSNGCVSIKDYEKFLKAYNDGEVKRLVVVASLNASMSVARRSDSQL